MYGFGYGLTIRSRRSTAPFVGPLDAFAGQLYAAFGLQRLLSTHTGKSVRVRRSSDAAETDIGFTVLGGLDTAALLGFAASGSAYVTRWYDQTGNGNRAEQATGAAQPRIVSAGVLDTGLNGRPIMAFSGGQYFDLPYSADFSRNVSAVTVAAVSGTTNAATVPAVFTSYNHLGSTRAGLGFIAGGARVSGRRVAATASQSIDRAYAGGAARVIGRLRYFEALADITVNGDTTEGAFQTPGATEDTAPTLVTRAGAFTNGTQALVGSMSALVLARAALPIAPLDVALSQVMQ